MKVTAPYNFVPLSRHVFLPEDKDLGGTPPAQDTPIDGGVSGVIPFSLTCDTPLLVAGPDTAPDEADNTNKARQDAPDVGENTE